MTDINTIKTDVKKKPKRYLTGVTFDFEVDENNPLGPHIALTTGLGAASGMNEAYLFKSVDHNNHNTNGAGVDDISGDKTVNTVVTTTTNKAGKSPAPLENEMDEKVLKEMKEELDALKAERDELNKKLKTTEVNKSLNKYAFTEDILKGITDVMVDLTDEQVTIVDSAFAFIAETVKVDVEKSLDEKKVEDNPLKKALEDEVGDTQTSDEPINKSTKQKVAEAREKYNL